ncbi:MAG TPA: hypothetical protein VNV86_12715 [Candidatus Acidoferrum sp.]|nr:hypothetical protein [Candidatus Acidoferrum sp.]
MERITQLAACEAFGLGAGQPGADQIRGALIEVKLEFVGEIGGCPSGPQGVGDTRNPGHSTP